MNEKFSPSDYKSFDELPEEQKSNYEQLDDGSSFVLKTVEKNPEIAYQLAIIEDKALCNLNQATERANLTIDEALQRLKEYINTRDADGMHGIMELLKQFADKDTLEGKDYDERIEPACYKASAAKLSYSEILQKIYLEEIDPNNIDVVAKLLKDKNFTEKKELLGLIAKENILHLYELINDDSELVEILAKNLTGLESKVDILKDFTSRVDGVEDYDEKKRLSYSLERIKTSTADSLIESHDYNTALNLVREGLLGFDCFKHQLHRLESDQLLFELTKRVYHQDDATEIIRYLTDEALLLRIVEGNSQEFPIMRDESRKTAVVGRASKVRNSLITEPEIYQTDSLGRQNRFVCGISSHNNNAFISWSNMGSHDTHKSIFDSADNESNISVPMELRSGGYIRIIRGDGGENPTKVVFFGTSGDYGYYSSRMLEKFRKQLTEVIKKSLNTENLNLIIETSG